MFSIIRKGILEAAALILAVQFVVTLICVAALPVFSGAASLANVDAFDALGYFANATLFIAIAFGAFEQGRNIKSESRDTILKAAFIIGLFPVATGFLLDMVSPFKLSNRLTMDIATPAGVPGLVSFTFFFGIVAGALMKIRSRAESRS